MKVRDGRTQQQSFWTRDTSLMPRVHMSDMSYPKYSSRRGFFRGGVRGLFLFTVTESLLTHSTRGVQALLSLRAVKNIRCFPLFTSSIALLSTVNVALVALLMPLWSIFGNVSRTLSRVSMGKFPGYSRAFSDYRKEQAEKHTTNKQVSCCMILLLFFGTRLIAFFLSVICALTLSVSTLDKIGCWGRGEAGGISEG